MCEKFEVSDSDCKSHMLNYPIEAYNLNSTLAFSFKTR